MKGIACLILLGLLLVAGLCFPTNTDYNGNPLGDIGAGECYEYMEVADARQRPVLQAAASAGRRLCAIGERAATSTVKVLTLRRAKRSGRECRGPACAA